jgi:hypothetical protein
MKEKINIEKLFQESLNQLDVNAPQDAWTNIVSRLNKKKKRRILPLFWWKLGGIAAALIVGFFLGRSDLFRLNEDSNNTTVIKNTAKPSEIKTTPIAKEYEQKIVNEFDSKANFLTKSKKTNSAVILSDEDIEKSRYSVSEKKSNKSSSVVNKNLNNTLANSETKPKISKSGKTIVDKNGTQFEKTLADAKIVEKDGTKNNQNKNTVWNKFQPSEEIDFQVKTKIDFEASIKLSDNLTDKAADNSLTEIANNKAINTATIGKQPIIGKKEINKKLDSTSIASAEPNALEELLHEKERKLDLNAEPKLNRWQVSTNVAPIYFSSLANGSPIDVKFESNQKSYNTSLSVGVGLQYALNKKLKIRTGVNNLSLDYNTNDIRFIQTAGAKTLQNVNTNLAGKLLEVQTVAEGPKGLTLADEQNELKVFSGSINQKLGYFEVPMEMSYSVINQKLGIEVLGGFSTMFLSQNEVNIVSSGLDMSIGEANNLNSIHFSGNLGFGIKYNIWKKLAAKIEPVFKYQFNTFSNNDGNFRPYVFGVYSGFSYTF